MSQFDYDEIIFPFNETLSFQCLNVIPPVETQKLLIKAELSFLYSTQFFAEINGEAALEHLKTLTYQPAKQNKILDMQIKDELSHVKLLERVVNKVGIDEPSAGFAKGYILLLHAAKSLAEKVFIFQIMTEAVSSAYLGWRLNKISSIFANSIDQQIYSDEIRHLKMGKSLLQMCESDELKYNLSAERRKILIRDMSSMCANHFSENIKRILKEHKLDNHFKIRVTDLDKLVAKTILSETKSISKPLDLVHEYA